MDKVTNDMNNLYELCKDFLTETRILSPCKLGIICASLSLQGEHCTVTASPTQSWVRGFHAAASSATAWAIWAMLGTLLGKLSQVYLGYNRQGGGSVREARIFQFEKELELER